MKTFWKSMFRILLICGLTALLFVLGFTIFSLTKGKVEFDKSLILEQNLVTQIFNQQNLPLDDVNTFSSTKIDFAAIPKHTADAFISIEDKSFYSHHGVNVKRMGKAFVKNLQHGKIVEGASTISQQLIKNTFLSSDKTYSRKINEIALALELEKNFSKDEILQNYLNVIYFGNNCYGIENAANFYFSKSTNNLSISESSLLAGLIKSPSHYCPIKHPENALTRRNLVLSEMCKDGKISQLEFEKNSVLPLGLNLNLTRKNRLNSYSENALDEASKILKMPAKQIAIAGYKIYTYQDLDKQICMENLLQKNMDRLCEKDYLMLNLDPNNGGITAFLGKSDYKILEHGRQPASIVKPLIVYTPALNEDIISPASLILDEQISINGYSPKNVGDVYHGYISVREAVSKSLNIPAVKTGSYLGLDKMQTYAKKLELPINQNDAGYSLALGGMTDGVNLKELASAYTALANGGDFIKGKFVKYITNKNGDVVYKNSEKKKRVFREDSAYLMTDILKTCAKTGTAKKLCNLPFEVAGKTGTNGNSKGNLDAYSLSYTTENVLGVWLGRMDNQTIDDVGGNLPTALARDYYNLIYSENKPNGFEKPNSVTEIDIDLNEYENSHNVMIANHLTPSRFKKTEIFSRFNLPFSHAEKILIAKPAKLNANLKDDFAVLSFDADKNLSYKLFKTNGEKDVLIRKIANEKGRVEVKFALSENEKASFFITTELLDDNENIISSERSDIVSLFNLKTTQKEPTKSKWFI